MKQVCTKLISVSGVSVNGTSLGFWSSNGHKIFIKTPGVDLDLIFTQLEALNTEVALRRARTAPLGWRVYVGREVESGDPWVGVFRLPRTGHICIHVKEHPSDKADSAEVIITAPDPLMRRI